MSTARRDFLKFFGGMAVALPFTPVPWKLLDDASIWTQNWSWLPSPVRGTESFKFNTCSLCPAGCGVKVRLIGDQPVSLSGVAEHPASKGALCPLGLGGHQLPYHATRIAGALSRQANGSFAALEAKEAVAAVAGAIASMKNGGAKESVAILDERPDRTSALLFRRFAAAVPNGIYVAAPRQESATLETLAGMFERPAGPFGIDLENTRTLLSFGAPVLDGWATPGRVMKARFGREQGLRIIQVDARQSRTASLADEWLPAKPGTEAVLALGIAHVLVAEKLCDAAALRAAKDFSGGGSSFEALIAAFPVEKVAEKTGLPAERIVELARSLRRDAPAVAIGGGDPGAGPLGKEEELAIAGLNLLLGSVGIPGGLIARREVPAPDGFAANLAPVRAIEDVPDGSIRVLISVGGSSGNALPWSLVERKLAKENRVVVSLAPHLDDYAVSANYILPTKTYLEALQDVPSPFDAAVASFSLSAPMIGSPEAAMDPGSILKRIAEAAGVEAELPEIEEVLKLRVAAIHKAGRGELFTYADGGRKPVKEVESADALWQQLAEGACWVDAAEKPAALGPYFLVNNAFDRLTAAGQGRTPTTAEAGSAKALVLLPFGARGDSGTAAVSPLMTKIYQESNLRSGKNQARVNPETGASSGLAHRKPAVLKTEAGSATVEVHFDPAVMPGVIEVAVGVEPRRLGNTESSAPGVLALLGEKEDRRWGMARVEVSRA